MRNTKAVLRITAGLTSLSLTVLMGATTIGLVPDEHAIVLESRAALSESIAIQCATLATKGQIGAMSESVDAIMQRNPELLRIAVKRQKGGYLIKNQAKKYEDFEEQGIPRESIVSIPLSVRDKPWGEVQLVFRPYLSGKWFGSLFSARVSLFLFAGGFGGLVFYFYLRKLLQDLDPSSVVPDRVRSTLNTLTEGLIVLDERQRIVLANESFANTVELPAGDLLGRNLKSLSWEKGDEVFGGDLYPWEETIEEGTFRTGATLELNINEATRCTFKVNSSPIFGEDGKPRGALVSFDDITAIEQNRAELEEMLSLLKGSRDELHQKNKELQLLATRDPLTSCWNRRSFFEQYENLWKRSLTEGRPIACVMVDIDHFKSINDQHGHSVGDQVLRGVAAALMEAAGPDDIVCRYGGEEFCVLMPGLDLDGACQSAERLRNEVASCEFPQLSVTASFGASVSTLGAGDPQALIDQADKSLYVAKRDGRNRVCGWDPSLEELEEKNLPRTAPQAVETQSTAMAIPFHAVAALLSALSYRDARTAEHSRRVADLCVILASKLMSAAETYIVEISALLHDIGKIGVPDAILLKPGPLTEDEWKVMQMHDEIGVGIIRSAFQCGSLTDIVDNHHAWFSGNPRDPDLPTGADIPVGARILSIADAFDAMVSDRVYRKGRSYEEAFAELRRCAGVQFDPELVEPFIECVASHNTSLSPGKVSKQAALNIGLQIESLASAVDKRDSESLATHAAVLRATATESGVGGIAELAEQLEEATQADADLIEMVQITNELLTLCRATQSAYIADEEETAETALIASPPTAPV